MKLSPQISIVSVFSLVFINKGIKDTYLRLYLHVVEN